MQEEERKEQQKEEEKEKEDKEEVPEQMKWDMNVYTEITSQIKMLFKRGTGANHFPFDFQPQAPHRMLQVFDCVAETLQIFTVVGMYLETIYLK